MRWRLSLIHIFAEAVKIPILLYNIPGRTGININPETIVDLCKNVENIVGVKEASGNFSSIAKIASLSDGWVDLYSGNDDQIVPLLSLGGKGVISVLSNIAPRQVHDMCELYFKGEAAKSTKMQLDAIPLIDALFCEVNPIPVKDVYKRQSWTRVIIFLQIRLAKLVPPFLEPCSSFSF